MIIYKVIIGVTILALIFFGKQMPSKKYNKLKWLAYILAILLWGAGQYFLQSTWIDAMLSILSIGFFILVIDSCLKDKR